MSRLLVPAILAATVAIAGVFAFIPVQDAATVHTSGTVTTADSADIDAILEDTGTTLDDFVDNLEEDLGDASGGTIGGTVTDGIEAIETQIGTLVETGTASISAGLASGGLTATNDGVAYVTVITTTNGATSPGLEVQVDGATANSCVDQAIVIADSPYTCAFAVAAGEVITISDAANNDGIGTALIVVVSNSADTT